MTDLQRQDGFQHEWAKECFALQRAARYHLRRQAFHDAWNNVTNGAGILLGAGTVLALVQHANALAIAAAVVITLLSTFNVVWGTSRRARLHDELHRRYVELEKAALAAERIDEQACRAARAQRLAIEADEPPTMFVVSVLSHNDVARATGAGDCFAVPLWQRWLAHFWAFPDARFAPVKRTA
jgi:hypothetical protein